MRPRPWLWATTVAILLAALGERPGGGIVFAQAPADVDFHVNTFTAGDQWNPAVAMAPNGSFVVVWRSPGQDGSGTAVIGQRFDASAAALGSEFLVNTYTTGDQGVSGGIAIAMSRRGDFVVVWSDAGKDGSGLGVFAQRFDRQGRPAGSEFQVNTATTGNQYYPDVGMGSNGQFVVAWMDRSHGGFYSIAARRFDAAGEPVGGDFSVDAVTGQHLEFPSVSVGAQGGFVVAFGQPDGSGYGVRARRFDAGGQALGGAFQVNTTTAADQRGPSVEMVSDGTFTVVWATWDAGPGGVHDRLPGQRFDASGARLGGEFQVAIYTTFDFVRRPMLAADQEGRFVVAWTGVFFDSNSYDVLARRLDSEATPRDPQFRVNNHTPMTQWYADAAVDAVGNFVVVWQGASPGDDGFGIQARRFGGLRPSALAVDDGGNGVLEVADTFTLRTSWYNGTGSVQTFQGAGSSVTTPAGLTLSLSANADYGTVANGAVGACSTCFAGTLAGTRPAAHVDVTFREDITPAVQGQAQRWSLHVGESFSDVPRASGFYRFIETLLHRGVTAGCTAESYCPGVATTRQQMAPFVLVAHEGAGYVPPACTTPLFADVPASSPFCRWIEELARRGVVSGCGGGNYCPTQPVTREQMAVFVLRTLDPALNPPTCTTPVFNDVPASSPFCRWIEELARRGVVSGCGDGNYCPTQPVTREQMSVFLGVTFGLTLYGP